MAFRFFENAMTSGAQKLPNDMHRDLQQEFVNLRWEDTSALFTIQEQSSIGSNVYNEIEAWMDSTVADTTTGLKDSNDFIKLIFKDINHRVIRGLMYQFDNNYWIVNNYSKYSGLVQQCGIRRCNNRLKIIDPLNGKLQIIPCCVDYDMTSPSQQTSRYIITPNNHAIIIVQGNDLTLRLFKTNTRYILSGRPFKLLAYQNAVEYGEEEQQSTLLYLDLYLDEIRDKDDLVNDIADNGEYDYSININADDMALVSGSVGVLQADVTLNGNEIIRQIVWKSDNKDVVNINSYGEYNVIGNSGESAKLFATLDGNDDVYSYITITVTEEEYIEPKLIVNPVFDKIRQYESINFNFQVEYNGNTYEQFDNLSVELIDNQSAQLIKNGDNDYSLIGLKISSPIQMIVNAQKAEPLFDIDNIFEFKVVSMMG